jgi:hypothetical protein
MTGGCLAFIWNASLGVMKLSKLFHLDCIMGFDCATGFDLVLGFDLFDNVDAEVSVRAGELTLPSDELS